MIARSQAPGMWYREGPHPSWLSEGLWSVFLRQNRNHAMSRVRVVTVSWDMFCERSKKLWVGVKVVMSLGHGGMVVSLTSDELWSRLYGERCQLHPEVLTSQTRRTPRVLPPRESRCLVRRTVWRDQCWESLTAFCSKPRNRIFKCSLYDAPGTC